MLGGQPVRKNLVDHALQRGNTEHSFESGRAYVSIRARYHSTIGDPVSPHREDTVACFGPTKPSSDQNAFLWVVKKGIIEKTL